MLQEGVMDHAMIDTSVTQEFQDVGKPKLLIGITVDQMRYDYLQRFEQDFQLDAGGFPRLIFEGLSNSNTHYNYVPTYTGPGPLQRMELSPMIGLIRKEMPFNIAPRIPMLWVWEHGVKRVKCLRFIYSLPPLEMS
jgi:hypothetical protein